MNKPYNYYEEVHSDILDFIEEEIEKDVADLTEGEIAFWVHCMEESMCVGGTMYGHYNVNDTKAAEYISGNAELLAKVLPWANETESIIESTSDIDVLCRCYLIPETFREVIAERKAVKAQEEADRAKETKELPTMTAYQRATWAKIYCEITLFSDWEVTDEEGEDFDRGLSLFLAGNEDTIKSCENFISEMLECFDDDCSTDHIRLKRLQKKLADYREFIG